ncbi:MAG TPA: hypothetical protein VIJ63_15490 [Roseiarcus sp.]
MRDLWRRGLSQIGLEPLEDFSPLEIEQSQADRPGRPECFDGFADCGGGIRGLNLGFGNNGWPVIGADANELKPEALWPHRENAFELFQRINLEKSDGGTHAQFPTATNEMGVKICPARFVGARSIRPPRNEVRHLTPMGGDFRRRCLSLALARLGICPDSEGCDQLIGVCQGSFGDFDVHRRATAR